jgi:transposase-like protein
MHKSTRARKITGTGGKDKAVVAGVLKRGSEVRAVVVSDTRRATLQAGVRQNVEAGSAVYSDALHAYVGLAGEYDHQAVDHAVKYVDGRVHVNGMENFWSLLKRGLHGTYVSVQPFHLFRYLDERVFTYNERELTDLERFMEVLGTVAGRRLTSAELTGKA